MSKSLLIFLLSALTLPTWAAERFGLIDALHGDAFLILESGQQTPLHAGDAVFAGQVVLTHKESEVHIATEDGGFVAVRPNSQLRIDAYKAERGEDGKIHMSLLRGAMRSITGWIARFNKNAYRLQTQTATIGIRGTDHETFDLDTPRGEHPSGTYDRVHEGGTVMQSGNIRLEVKAGETGVFPNSGSGLPRILAKNPDFMDDHQLRLENRIEKRREALRESLDKMPDAKVEQLQEVFRDATPEQREKMRQRAIRKMRNRND
jgi:hypothetical protein